MSPEKKVSALWICPLLQMHRFPFKPLAKVGAFTRPIAQFTLVFWIYFSFMRKPHPRLTNKDTEEMLLVGPNPSRALPSPRVGESRTLAREAHEVCPQLCLGLPAPRLCNPSSPCMPRVSGIQLPTRFFFFFFLLTFRTAFLPSNTNSRL